MSGFIIFLAYALIILALLGVLYWGLQSVNLPQPVKVAIIVIVVAVGVIYFVNSGMMPALPHR